MKQVWENLREAVGLSRLQPEERTNILEHLDSVLGRYLLESRFPLERGSLTENEWIVCREILRAINEGRKFTKVNNDFQYNKVVKEIFKAVDNKPDTRLKKKLLEMDTAFENGDWKEINKQLDIISNMV